MIGVNKFRHDEMPFINEKMAENEESTFGFELLTDLRLSQIFEK